MAEEGCGLPVTDVVAPVAARLREFVPSREVYEHGVPDGTLPPRYLLVTASAGEVSSTNLADKADRRSPVVFVTSVCRHAVALVAAREALWGADAAVTALTDWRPSIGAATWKPSHVSSLPPRRDDDLPDVVMVAVEQFVLAYQPS